MSETYRKETAPLADGRRRLNYWEKEYVESKPKTIKSSFVPQGHFEFLKLPSEIRNRIYDLVFIKSTNIGGPGAAISSGLFKEIREHQQLGLVRACRQTYNECRDTFMIKNTFEFFFALPALTFLVKIGARRRALVTKLIFHQNEFGPSFNLLRFLKSCTSLIELQVSVRVRDRDYEKVWWEFPLKDALEFFLGTPSKLSIGMPQASGSEASSVLNLRPKFSEAPYGIQRLIDHAILVKREQAGEWILTNAPDVFAEKGRIIERFSKPSNRAIARFSDDFIEVDMTECLWDQE